MVQMVDAWGRRYRASVTLWKPHLRWDAKLQLWRCQLRSVPSEHPKRHVTGFGYTAREAFERWTRRCVGRMDERRV